MFRVKVMYTLMFIEEKKKKINCNESNPELIHFNRAAYPTELQTHLLIVSNIN